MFLSHHISRCTVHKCLMSKQNNNFGCSTSNLPFSSFFSIAYGQVSHRSIASPYHLLFEVVFDLGAVPLLLQARHGSFLPILRPTPSPDLHERSSSARMLWATDTTVRVTPPPTAFTSLGTPAKVSSPRSPSSSSGLAPLLPPLLFLPFPSSWQLPTESWQRFWHFLLTPLQEFFVSNC